MAVQVNDIVHTLCKLLDCSVLSCIILYVDGNSLFRNDESCIDILKFHSCMLVISMNWLLLLDEIRLTDSISGRNACPMEEVTSTQRPALFWRNEGFGEWTMHYTSATSWGEFRAEIMSYDRNQSCLVSSLSFCSTASRNRTTVTCTSRDRSSNESLSLHNVSSECVRCF